MKSLLTFVLLLLLLMIGLTGCYTQLGYYASSDFDGRYHKVLKKEKMEHASKSTSESEESELEEHVDDEVSEGYYGRWHPTYRNRYVSPYRYDTYWTPYAPYPYYAYSPLWYYPNPWFYGYYAPYYRYYPNYYPYRNVYQRYHGGSRYVPLSRRTYNNRGTWRSESRRSRSSRSVTSPRTRSERPQRRGKTRNAN